MGSLLSFIFGIFLGVVGAWWFFERRDAESRKAMEESWKKKLEHVEAEVKRADAAHDETKERLRRLQQERLPAPEAPPPPAGAPAPVPLPPAATPVVPAPAVDQPLSEAERIAQAKRRIDAKLAQLPAGSSARQRLLAERSALEQPAASLERGEAPKATGAEDRPMFTAPADAPDDLERIRGIGPVLRQRLNKLGITTFAQIAAFTEADLQRIDEVLDFKGRIVREGWVEQAKVLRDQG